MMSLHTAEPSDDNLLLLLDKSAEMSVIQFLQFRSFTIIGETIGD